MTTSFAIQTRPNPEPAPSEWARIVSPPVLPAPRPRLSPGAAEPDRVLVVGEPRRARRVRSSLEGDATMGPVVTAASVPEALRWLEEGDAFHVVVVVVPLPGATLERAIRRLRGALPRASDAALVALVPESFSEARVHEVYHRGASGVFAWPDDVPVLGSLIETAALARPPRGEALEIAIHARLGARLDRVTRDLAVETKGGIVRLSGTASSLWAKLALKRQASGSPGVESVEASEVEVAPSERGDAAIGRDIRALLDGTISVDASTLGVSVHAGKVVLVGTVLEDERDRVLELLSLAPGVRSVADLAVGSRKDKRRASELAARLDRDVRERGSGPGLRVAVVGSTAVLRGIGSRRETQKALQRLRARARRHESIQRVVDRVPHLQLA